MTRLRPAILLACTALAASAGLAAAQSTGPGASLVSVGGTELLVRRRNADGTLQPRRPYIIRGVNWSPADRETKTSKNDPNNAAVRRIEFGQWAATDIPLMAAMNINTVRLPMDPGLDSTGLGVLDALHSHGIMAILTVDDAINDMARVASAVNFYKNHPAVLMWMLGNEWNIWLYYGHAPDVPTAAQQTEKAAALIKTLDTQHPVATGYGEIDIDAADMRLADTARYVNEIAPSVDIWGLNIYRTSSFGTLFSQWRSITGKPMFLAEFGADACRTSGSGATATCQRDEAAQAAWNLGLWNELFRRLSARDPAEPVLGGTLFEWNDEWWKVEPFDRQDPGGWASAAFPDLVGNEDWSGIVDIDRAPRATYTTMTTAFAPAYLPAAASSRFAVVSAGGSSGSFAELFRGSTSFYRRTGGGGGGRGFNVAVIDRITGELIGQVRNFDTWGSRSSGTDMNAMIGVLDAAPTGALLLIGVGDEAGLNAFDSCTRLAGSWVEQALQRLESLGATQIRQYCYRDSWSLLTVKGEGIARDEKLGHGLAVTAEANIAQGDQLVVRARGAGTGAVTSNPTGLDCAGVCRRLFADGTVVTLTATPSAGSAFAGWGGDADCSDGVVTLSGPRSCEPSWTRAFTDHALARQLTTIRAVHITELRTRIDAARAAFGLPAFSWTTTVEPGATIGVTDVLQLRTALAQAFVASARATPAWSRTIVADSTVNAADVAEIRDRVIEVE
jgi:hypothetical protein